MGDEQEQDLFFVVRNIEEQYSVWPAGREVPDGWEMVGTAKPKSECLAYIGEVWTDLRPASLRRSMAANEVTS
ncbi:MbtH family protein [Amycolatopsis sp. lyj-23]|uniref:MbtH family protein n=1 Tax=Amycolatopsis sp. lyj-23 TaxID=2789283 RepID=UPI00397949F9